jgi:hypothetical protein
VPPDKIFGFDVSATGEVNLPKTCGVVLYRLDDIPLPQPEDTGAKDDACQIRKDGDRITGFRSVHHGAILAPGTTDTVTP